MNMHKHRAEALRRLRANQYELTDDGGVLVPEMGIKFAGAFQVQVNDGPWSIEPNLVVNEGILHLLTVGMAQGTQDAAFYIAPFSGNVTPVSTWTAANFTANATEYTAYAETTRVLWAKDAAAANAIVNNTTPALFTINGGGGTLRGAGLMSVATKSGTTGYLIAAARFSADKAMVAGEELRVKYTLTGSSS